MFLPIIASSAKTNPLESFVVLDTDTFTQYRNICEGEVFYDAYTSKYGAGSFRLNDPKIGKSGVRFKHEDKYNLLDKDFIFECWLRVEYAGDKALSPALLSKRGLPGKDGYSFFVARNYLGFVYSKDGSEVKEINVPITLKKMTWHNIKLTRQSNTLSFYLNDDLIKSVPFQDTIFANEEDVTCFYSAVNPCQFKGWLGSIKLTVI